MSKELSLYQVQQRLLNCLISINKCCRKNNINYSLDFGTLLGAVRHKGFIPWDDDMDLLMTRDNYDRFIKCYNDPDYDMVCGGTKDWGMHFIRICDNKTIIKWKDGPVYEKSISHGLWIAIFPIDSVPSDDKKWSKLKKGCDFFAECIRLKKGMWAPTGFLRNIIKAAVRFSLLPFSEFFLLKQQEKILTKYNKSQTSYCFQKGTIYHVFPSEWFKSYIDLDFEGYKFMAISHYDDYLRHEYGDYMKFPPKEQQVPKHEYDAYLIG